MRFHRALVIISLAAMSQGCAGCIGREFTIKRTFQVTGETTDPLCKTSRQEVNLGNDQGFNDLKGFVSKIELRKLVVSVTNPKTRDDSLATKGSGSVSVSAQATGDVVTLSTYGDVDIAAGSVREIEFDKAAATTLTSLALNPPNTFFIESQGCSNANPAFYEFQVALTFYAGL